MAHVPGRAALGGAPCQAQPRCKRSRYKLRSFLRHCAGVPEEPRQVRGGSLGWLQALHVLRHAILCVTFLRLSHVCLHRGRATLPCSTTLWYSASLALGTSVSSQNAQYESQDLYCLAKFVFNLIGVCCTNSFFSVLSVLIKHSVNWILRKMDCGCHQQCQRRPWRSQTNMGMLGNVTTSATSPQKQME